MNTTLYFGSFNPVHRGHIAVAEYMLTSGIADSVRFVLSPQSPFKTSQLFVTEEHRAEMMRRAIQESGMPGLDLSTAEFTMPRPSYTVDTLRYFKSNEPQTTFSLLIGADNVEGFELWRESSVIRTLLANIYVYPRSGCSVTAQRASQLGMTLLEDAPQIEVSSTDIRRKVASRVSLDELESVVPSSVAEYIKKEGIYANGI